MVIRNLASIEIRTAFRFVYDQKSQVLVYEKIEELSNKLDKYIGKGLDANRSNSAQICEEILGKQAFKELHSTYKSYNIERLKSFESDLLAAIDSYQQQGEKQLGS